MSKRRKSKSSRHASGTKSSNAKSAQFAERSRARERKLLTDINKAEVSRRIQKLDNYLKIKTVRQEIKKAVSAKLQRRIPDASVISQSNRVLSNRVLQRHTGHVSNTLPIRDSQLNCKKARDRRRQIFRTGHAAVSNNPKPTQRRCK